MRHLRRALVAMTGAAVLTAGAATGDSYTYGYSGVEAAAHAEGVLSDGSRFLLRYSEAAGAATDTRYVNAVNEDAGGQITVCIERRVSSRKVLSDCGHAPLSAADVDRAQLTGGTFTVDVPSTSRRGSTITATISLKAAADTQVMPQVFDPGLSPAILAAGAGGQVTRSMGQDAAGDIRSSWLGGGTIRRTSQAALWESITSVSSATATTATATSCRRYGTCAYLV